MRGSAGRQQQGAVPTPQTATASMSSPSIARTPLGLDMPSYPKFSVSSTDANSAAANSGQAELVPFEFAVGQDASADQRAYTCARYGCCMHIPKIGNMTPVWETRSADGERRLNCVVGPFWPVGRALDLFASHAYALTTGTCACAGDGVHHIPFDNCDQHDHCHLHTAVVPHCRAMYIFRPARGRSRLARSDGK